MSQARDVLIITYVDRTMGAVREWHSVIMDAIRNDGRLPEELADLLTVTKAPVLNADGTVRWIVDFA